MYFNKLLFLFCIYLINAPALADLSDVQLRGFGSIVAGVVVDGDGYIAEYPNLGIYQDYLDLSPESRLGLQAKVPLFDNVSVTAQLISRGSNDFNVEIDWFYLTYEFTIRNRRRIGNSF